MTTADVKKGFIKYISMIDLDMKLLCSVSHNVCTPYCTCMFAAELSEAGSRGRGGAISPGQEEGGAFYCQEALTDTGERKGEGERERTGFWLAGNCRLLE